MDLFYREFGERGRTPLLVLHGLLGSSRNWQGAGRRLGKSFHVMALDMRNHGDSPHVGPHHFSEMVEDVLEFMDQQEIERCVLLGHSMGGKVAMKLACESPRRICSLVVVDILPIEYPGTHDKDFAGMRALPLRQLDSRTEAEELLEPHVDSWAMRKFLVTNLERDEQGGFRWQVNLDAIVAAQRHLEQPLPEANQSFDGPTLFVMGGKSSYFVRSKLDSIRPHFPAAAVEVIEESGHNPHFETRDRFVELVEEFAGGR